MTKMERTRRYHEVGLKIEEKLASGYYKASERLPSERELSEEYETSRSTIREAIIMLELKGLVEVRQGAGIFFKEPPVEEPSSIPLVGSIGPFELLQSRYVLETSIVEFAARNIKLSELRVLRDIIQRQENNIENSDEFEDLDREFHLCIANATQNRMLIETANRLWNVVRTENPLWQQLNLRYLHEKPLKESWLIEHKKIFSALQQRDPALAKQAMIEHLEHSKSELKKLIEVGEQDLFDFEDMFFLDDN